MKKIIKKGLGILATTACALTFAYAQPKTETKVEPYTLEKTVEIYQEYYEKLNEAALTMQKITKKEIQELNNFLKKHLPYIKHSPKKIEGYLMSEKSEISAYFIKKTNKSEKIEDIIKTLEEKILCLYPGLVNKEKTNIAYDPDEDLEREQREVLKSLVERIQKISPKIEDSIVFKKIEDKCYLELRDLAALYFLAKQIQKDTPNLEKQEEIKKIKVKIADLTEHQKAYEAYLNGFEDFQKWRTKWIGGSLFTYIDDWKKNKDAKAFLKEKIGPSMQPTTCSIEDYNEDTIETKLPWYAWIPISFLGTSLFKLLITKYTRRKWDDIDTAHSISSPLLGFMFFDCIHPWVMPIRLLALPIIEEVLAKEERK